MGDDGELDFSDYGVFPGCDLHTSASMEAFLDDLLKGTHTCTHTHTCNPPGPDNTHTHTCFHTHTQLFASGDDGDDDDEKLALPDKSDSDQRSISSSKRKRPVGNREAVRKYREKKKAHTAFLEEQVNHLKILNQQLLRRLQGQAAVEAEVARLRSILSEFRGRIDAELGLFPFSKPCAASRVDKSSDCTLQTVPGGHFLSSVTVPCDEDVPCLHGPLAEPRSMHHLPDISKRWNGSCDLVSDACQGLGLEGDVGPETQ
ncbi:hypothetical protein O6H91_08G047800 [Diphasiastrum complanatum]|uniref:Uncharacterized protein n=1 Tax=Diphasiastrum complanatum TaxID=34168 RepID=A0ACC2CY91_DIPCM|nr:hypothetical protein O6H91_08G047800 [Diphasiastrum complanatum]